MTNPKNNFPSFETDPVLRTKDEKEKSFHIETYTADMRDHGFDEYEI
jgi:hypothetical protein